MKGIAVKEIPRNNFSVLRNRTSQEEVEKGPKWPDPQKWLWDPPHISSTKLLHGHTISVSRPSRGVEFNGTAQTAQSYFLGAYFEVSKSHFLTIKAPVQRDGWGSEGAPLKFARVFLI